MEQKKHWWEGYPWRMVQTNLREIDMEDIDAEAYARQMKDFGATVVTLNAAGIIASYDTRLPFHTKSEYLHGSSLREIVDACHKRGIRVIARMDFSKIRFPLYERHTDWAYRDRDGNILNYNGSVQTCPNGGYQGEAMFEILREALTEIPFDGVFCNMAGFLVVDYSGVYHGPCHCENCKRLFKAQYGGDVPEKDDFRNPAYRKYTAFKSACLKAHKEKMIAAIRGVSPEIAIKRTWYEHYSEDGLTTYDGTETFSRDADGCTYEAHVTAVGREAGEMNLRLRFVQPNMWSAAKVDFSIAADGRPQSHGQATWQGKTLYVDTMKE